MKLFVSYARVDKPYCVQIVRALSGHDIWYDQRLFAGTNWWHEIYRRLEWCEGFLWLLSPESVSSTACLREFNLAHSLGRIVFPLLIHPETEVPEPCATFTTSISALACSRKRWTRCCAR